MILKRSDEFFSLSCKGWSGKTYVGYISLYDLGRKSDLTQNVEWLSEPGWKSCNNVRFCKPVEFLRKFYSRLL